MNTETKKKIEFLQKYLRKKYFKWHQMHPDNIVGFRIDKKVTNGKKERNYSVIFHVKKKKKEKVLSAQELVPPFFMIKFPDGKIRKIKTDVEQTGMPKLQLSECRKPIGNGQIELGTAGVILRDGPTFFALTNYHVAAFQLMQQGQFRFKGQDNNIFLDGNRETFVDGIFSREIDAAFIRLSGSPFGANNLGQGVTIRSFLNGPLSPVLQNKTVVIYSARLRRGIEVSIKTNSATFQTNFQNIFLEDVIQISPKMTIKGDSGGVVMINSSVLVGIIVGADDYYSYAIPFFKINNFKPLTIA